MKRLKHVSKHSKLENGVLQILVKSEWLPVPLDDYENLHLVGEGANGVVVSGIHKLTKRKDAIKVFFPNLKSKTGIVSVEQFLNETRKLASIKNPAIVTVYNAANINKDIHIVTMEYVEGITLKEWLGSNFYIKRPGEKIKRVLLAKKILEAILFYQEQGIIHGDIHTNNVLVSEHVQDADVDIHIIDFGTSFFGKAEQSEQRESFFVYELTRQILGKFFDKDYFTVSCTQKINDSFIENDVRKKYPLLVTKTMLAYVRMLDFILQMGFTDLENHIERIVPSVVAIADGVYIDATYFANSFYAILRQKINRENIWQILVSNMEERCFPEVPKDYGRLEQRYQNSFQIYFQMALETRTRWNVMEAKKLTFKYCGNLLTEEEYDKYMEVTCDTDKKYYSDLEKSDIWNDDNWRMVIKDALITCMGKVAFLQEVWIRFNEAECMIA